MIKKIIACLTICFIITGLFNPVFSHAEPIPIYTPNWDNPGIAEIINISDLTGWMANGGVYDVTSFQNLDEFLSWYFKLRVPIKDEDGNITFAPTYGYDTYLDSGYKSPRFIEQSNVRGMIARSYQNKTGYGRRIQEQVDNALINDGNLQNVLIPLMNQNEAAFFVGYNTNAINRYRYLFVNGEPVTPSPDPNYTAYIDLLNGNGFWFKNWVNQVRSQDGVTYLAMNSYPMNLNSYFKDTSSSAFPSYETDTYTVQGINSILRLDITSNNGTYYFNKVINITNDEGPFNRVASHNVVKTHTTNLYTGNLISTTSSSNNSYYYNTSGTLSNVLSYISNYFRNVDLYVDGSLWALAGSAPTEPVPEFPDVVGGEELPVTTWPVTVPKAPYYINLPGLRQAFQRAKNTDNQFDINDLKYSVVDPEGDPITDPEFDNVPVPIPNPDPVNPEVVPELPDLPLIPPANNPGFNGVSVLAEIINFTNQSLPSGLITVFWGIVFGAVILGIIKILHK